MCCLMVDTFSTFFVFYLLHKYWASQISLTLKESVTPFYTLFSIFLKMLPKSDQIQSHTFAYYINSNQRLLDSRLINLFVYYSKTGFDLQVYQHIVKLIINNNRL